MLLFRRLDLRPFHSLEISQGIVDPVEQRCFVHCVPPERAMDIERTKVPADLVIFGRLLLNGARHLPATGRQ